MKKFLKGEIHVIKDFSFLSATDVRFGLGIVKTVGKACRDLGLERVLVVSDPFMVSSGTVKKVTDVLEAEHIGYAVYSDFEPSPPISKVIKAYEYMREHDYQGVIGFRRWQFTRHRKSHCPPRKQSAARTAVFRNRKRAQPHLSDHHDPHDIRNGQ